MTRTRTAVVALLAVLTVWTLIDVATYTGTITGVEVLIALALIVGLGYATARVYAGRNPRPRR